MFKRGDKIRVKTECLTNEAISGINLRVDYEVIDCGIEHVCFKMEYSQFVKPHAYQSSSYIRVRPLKNYELSPEEDETEQLCKPTIDYKNSKNWGMF